MLDFVVMCYYCMHTMSVGCDGGGSELRNIPLGVTEQLLTDTELNCKMYTNLYHVFIKPMTIIVYL